MTGTRFSRKQPRELPKITGYTQQPQYAEERAGDVKHSLADISRTQEAIGYRPTVAFEDGLRRTVEWYKFDGFGSDCR